MRRSRPVNKCERTNTIGAAVLTPSSVKAPLRECGYRTDLLRTDFLFGADQTVPLVAFAQPPTDSRSACVAVLSETSGPRAAVEACRPLGTPLVFVCFQLAFVDLGLLPLVEEQVGKSLGKLIKRSRAPLLPPASAVINNCRASG